MSMRFLLCNISVCVGIYIYIYMNMLFFLFVKMFVCVINNVMIITQRT